MPLTVSENVFVSDRLTRSQCSKFRDHQTRRLGFHHMLRGRRPIVNCCVFCPRNLRYLWVTASRSSIKFIYYSHDNYTDRCQSLWNFLSFYHRSALDSLENVLLVWNYHSSVNLISHCRYCVRKWDECLRHANHPSGREKMIDLIKCLLKFLLFLKSKNLKFLRIFLLRRIHKLHNPFHDVIVWVQAKRPQILPSKYPRSLSNFSK